MVAVLLVACIAWGVFAFGAVYQWAYVPLLMSAALTGAAALATSGVRNSLIVPIAIAALTAGAIALQLIPLSPSSVAQLSPASDRILRTIDLAYANLGKAHPISVAPSRTASGLLFFISLVVFSAGISQWLTRDRVRRLAGAIVAIGAVLAVGAIAQRVLSPTLVYGQPSYIYGFWTPYEGRDPFGPFVNKNHFAGWMLMAIPVALGLAAGTAARVRTRPAADWRRRIVGLSDETLMRSFLIAFCGLIMTVSLVLTLSRSGITSIAVALLLGSVIALRSAGRRLRTNIGVVAGAVLLAAIWAGADTVAERFAALDTVTFEGRAAMWNDALTLTREAPITGIGIRAYTVASLVYQKALPEFHVSAAHSDWLQLAAEGGLLTGVPALILLGVLTRQGARRFAEHVRRRDWGTTYWIRAGAATGLFAIALQSCVEFSLQMPGNTVMFASLWAITIAPLEPTPRS